MKINQIHTLGLVNSNKAKNQMGHSFMTVKSLVLILMLLVSACPQAFSQDSGTLDLTDCNGTALLKEEVKTATKKVREWYTAACNSKYADNLFGHITCGSLGKITTKATMIVHTLEQMNSDAKNIWDGFNPAVKGVFITFMEQAIETRIAAGMIALDTETLNLNPLKFADDAYIGYQEGKVIAAVVQDPNLCFAQKVEFLFFKAVAVLVEYTDGSTVAEELATKAESFLNKDRLHDILRVSTSNLSLIDHTVITGGELGFSLTASANLLENPKQYLHDLTTPVLEPFWGNKGDASYQVLEFMVSPGVFATYEGMGLYDQNGVGVTDQDIDGDGNADEFIPHNRYVFEGDIIAERLAVAADPGTFNDWADYVFDPGYDLRSIDEVEAFIKENGHLPEVLSTAEVKEQGLDIVKMDITLLKKVEELTLYVIEQNKQLAVQSARLDEMKQLKERITALEQLLDNNK